VGVASAKRAKTSHDEKKSVMQGSSVVSLMNFKEKDKQRQICLAKQAFWYIYSRQHISKETFEDESFKQCPEKPRIFGEVDRRLRLVE
jgi:hypothetical protein